MKIKTAELTGSALDWVVAKCEGAMYCLEISPTRNSWESMGGFNARYSEWKGDGFGMDRPAYSTDWAVGGPIIEREGINVGRHEWVGPSMEVISWSAERYATEKPGKQIGPTPLIAAMRCFVYSRLGDTVDIPNELIS